MSGIKSIETPDGEIHNENTIMFSVNENNEYEFKAVDRAGNISTEIVNIKNIYPNITIDSCFFQFVFLVYCMSSL